MGEDESYLRLPCPFLDFTTLYDSIESKTSILIDRGKGIQIQVAVALAGNGLGHSEGWRWKELGLWALADPARCGGLLR